MIQLILTVLLGVICLWEIHKNFTYQKRLIVTLVALQAIAQAAADEKPNVHNMPLIIKIMLINKKALEMLNGDLHIK